ncbi:Haloacid dehalogenase-like hydrolase domain containing protein 2 [Dissostichus eleginoides]|uniref:Haloacid dehalogenase-like hydrolase domain-containing protein 2 n=1 Tax=Dissostichus eleginoides TaxID=100907 RepID=A0AAD9BKK5_DISEL|nr:Haloacid dehalogenase-like hydrolase domain containing protein 2 [Dissostichus eleginoides]
MAFTLYSLIQTAILCTNAVAVLHEERFLSKFGWGVDQGVGGFGDDPGVKAQILTLIRSVRTVMRGEQVSIMAGRRALKAVLIDLSGTLHIEDTAVPGAQDALNRLRQASVDVKFVTNTTKESKRSLLERLQRLDFHVQEKEIFTSLSAARSLVERKQLRPLLLLEDSIDTSEPNAVVIGLSPDHFNYQTLDQAFRMVLEGAPLIAIHKARYYKRADGLALGPGPFVAGLEFAADCRATVVGKPEKRFFTQALSDLGCSPTEAVMIGDDARDDVGGAQNAGMLGILVRTGKYREGDEDKINPPPHLTCDSFPEAVAHILKKLL